MLARLGIQARGSFLNQAGRQKRVKPWQKCLS